MKKQMLTGKVTLTFLHNYSEISGKAFFENILRLLFVNEKNFFSAVPGLFNLSMKNITSRSITLRWTRARKLNSTWQDRQIFVQIASEPGLIRNDSFPSIVGTGNMKLFTDLSPYTKYKFTLREVAGNFSGNSTSISFITSEDGKRYIRFSKLVQ